MNEENEHSNLRKLGGKQTQIQQQIYLSIVGYLRCLPWANRGITIFYYLTNLLVLYLHIFFMFARFSK